ncbi:MAG: hypothetical protein JNN18_18185 [Rubrivivax sp.]|nr:hypothetical protein [Rubrivivax sp.]
MSPGPLAPLRLLHVPNEVIEGDQVGPRAAFGQMLQAGTLAAYAACPWNLELRRAGPAAAATRLLDAAAQLRPDWVLWQHVGADAAAIELLPLLRRAAPGARLLYHEGDLYGRGKPMPAATRALVRAADAVALVSHGAFAAQVRTLTRAVVLYAPSAADLQRFGASPPAPPPEPAFDVVMIGNRVRSRLPWRRMPGAAERSELARRLARRHGPRFALWGHGWRGHAGWQGPVAYAEQQQVLRRGHVAAAWGHYDREAGYFSDRLPIGLLSGVPQVVNRQPGYRELFGDDPPLALGAGVGGVVQAVDALLAMAPHERAELARRADAYARAHLTAEVVYPRLLREAVRAVGVAR